MNIVYFSHRYRKEDAELVRYFGRLMRSENLLPSLDPPSEAVNVAKLERHLNSSDGMVAVITRREGGPSQHILFEITLCLRARKPLIVFVEDELPNDIVPARILQRRFSRRSYLRQLRQHRHGLQNLKVYLGDQPPPRYQPSSSRRSCLLVGIDSASGIAKRVVPDIIESSGYSPLDLSVTRRSEPDAIEIYESIACADLALCFVDSTTPESQFLMGAVQATFIPAISFSFDQRYKFNPQIPIEYQPRIVAWNRSSLIKTNLGAEINIYEEDFVELDNQKEVETYATLLVDVASKTGDYDAGTRNTFIQELIMGDQYKAGQAGAMGPGAHAQDMTFNQIWNEMQGQVDLGKLAEDLSALRQAMKQEALEPEQDLAVAEIARAEQAAKANDGSKVVEHLKSAGKWALDVATKIGTSVAVEAIKGATGMK